MLGIGLSMVLKLSGDCNKVTVSKAFDDVNLGLQLLQFVNKCLPLTLILSVQTDYGVFQESFQVNSTFHRCSQRSHVPSNNCTELLWAAVQML